MWESKQMRLNTYAQGYGMKGSSCWGEPIIFGTGGEGILGKNPWEELFYAPDKKLLLLC